MCTVSEGVRLKVQIERSWIDPQQGGQILLGIEQVPHDGLGAAHVLVFLDPGSRRDLPAALRDAAADLRQKIGTIFLDDSVGRRLRLRKHEIRVFLHEVQHRLEGIDNDAGCFVRAPHPVHVDVRMRCAQKRIVLGKR